MGSTMRIELLHPMMVHFPIALLLLGAALRIISAFIRSPFFFRLSWAVLILGIGSSWIAVYLGDLAADIVRPTLCDPGALHTHISWGKKTATFFSVVFLLDLIGAEIARRRPIFRLAWTLGVGFLFALAAAALLTTAYFGGQLVYEQGAAVQKCCKARPNLD